MTSISTVQRGLDLETDHGVQSAFTNYAVEENKLLLELLAAARDLRGRVSSLVVVLRDVDRAGRTTGGEGLIPPGVLLSGVKRNHVGERNEGEYDEREDEEGRFVPWKGWGVERLLLKLDWAGREAGGG